MEEQFVDKFAAVVRVNAKQSEGQAGTYELNGFENGVLVAREHSQAFGPASRDIHAGQSVHILTICGLSTVGYQGVYVRTGIAFFSNVPGFVVLKPCTCS